MIGAYYNEIDPFAVAWLRELIKAGRIADGEVDDRSIKDVQPNDLKGFTQCHFFAGIGAWSHALRWAKWRDDRPVWTGSCPCQPFSVAGKQRGTDDERHLWPEFYRLIAEWRPATVFGEQVASPDGRAWLSTVRVQMEVLGYGVGCADLCAAGVGAPHLRQRLWFVADSGSEGLERHSGNGGGVGGREEAAGPIAEASIPRNLADPEHQQHEGRMSKPGENTGEEGRGETAESTGHSEASGLAKPNNNGHDTKEGNAPEQGSDGPHYRISLRDGPTRGPWTKADWLYCRDGKYRAVKPGSSPLVDGVTSGVERKRWECKLRGYGNAIVAPVAKVFIEAYMEVI